jgi:hypothetical protein
MKVTSFLATSLAVLSLSAAAHAQESSPDASGSTPQSDEQRGRDISDRAYGAYQKGDYSNAIALYLEAYKLSPSAAILYNVARIYDQKIKDPKLALEYYRRHNAASDASPSLVGKATTRIAELQAQLEGPKPAPVAASTPVEPPPEPAKSHPQKTAGMIVAGAGALSLGVGIVSGIVTSSKHGSAKDGGCSGDVCTTQQGLDDEKSAKTWGTVSTVTFITGGALLAGGLALYFTAPASASTGGERAAFRIVPQAGSDGAGLMAIGRF